MAPCISQRPRCRFKVDGAAADGSPLAPGVQEPVREHGAPSVHPNIPNSRRGRVASPHVQGREMDVFVGIDVSKDRLDICVRPSGETFAVGAGWPYPRPARAGQKVDVGLPSGAFSDRAVDVAACRSSPSRTFRARSEKPANKPSPPTSASSSSSSTASCETENLGASPLDHQDSRSEWNPRARSGFKESSRLRR